MESRLRTHGFAFAAVVCAALAVAPAIAQENVEKAGGSGAIAGGTDLKGSDTSPAGDGAIAARGRQESELGVDATRKGTPGTAPGGKGATLDHGINLIAPDDGYAGLRRRAMRKTLIANAVKKPAALLAGTGTTQQLIRRGPDGGMVRNAVGMVVPAGDGVGGPGSIHHGPGFMAHAGTDASGSRAGPTGTSTIGSGAGTGGLGGENHHPTILPGTAAGPVHTAVVSGTAMGHIVSGPAVVGGPAKGRTGINGTSLRPK
jgi:hypothetical protein